LGFSEPNRPKQVLDQLLRADDPSKVLISAWGRSYGDVCLNTTGRNFNSKKWDHFISFDRTSGLLTVEAGVTLREILRVVLPAGWFLPVVPGTQWLSVAGAVANDIHGKNHHVAGTFGRHVCKLWLSRSDQAALICSPESNPGLWAATIGGLGLTGLITAVQLQLVRVESSHFEVDYLPFYSLDEFIALSATSDEDYAYSVAWVDCLNKKYLNRGIFMRGYHAPDGGLLLKKEKSLVKVPFDFPDYALNRWSMSRFNDVYFSAHKWLKAKRQRVYFEDFLFPLDGLASWNRIYGRQGFYQYQFVLPLDAAAGLKEIFSHLTKSGLGSFLAVLKIFGSAISPGMLSFPKQGYTLALDFPNRGESVLHLFRDLDKRVADCGGRLYPAKDALMTEEMFHLGYPRWAEFQEHMDPMFASDFARRVGLLARGTTL
jgi:FAD/FMN-containing dehydrogenase